MQNEIRQYYLQAMGIRQWYLKSSVSSGVSSVPRALPAPIAVAVPLWVAQYRRCGGQWGIILADASIELDVQAKERELLTAIVKAMILKPPTAITYYDLSSRIEWRADQQEFAGLLLGSQVIAQYASLFSKLLLNSQIDISLRQLLQQPHLKASVWQALQPLC